MDEVLVDLRKLDLADRIGSDMLTVEQLLYKLEDALDEIEILRDRLEEKKEEEPDEYDRWLELHSGD